MFRRTLFTIMIGCLTLPIATQVTQAAHQQGNAKASQNQSASKPQGMTIDAVVEMVQAGLSEDLVVASLRKEAKAFDLSPADMIRLKKSNVSDNIIKVMLDPKAEIKSTTQPASGQAGPPIVVQTPVVAGVRVASPSGATPAPGGNVTGDPNDPMTPHDSGIYLYAKDRDGKPQMIVLERAAYQGTKTGGLLGTSLTGGIMKAKTKAVIPGARASIKADTNPVFYFYFDEKAAGLGKGVFGGNVSNPNQFVLLKLDVNKSNRETVVMEIGAYSGVSSGTNEKSMVTFKSERIQPGLYKVAPAQPLQKGEYAFLASLGLGAYTSGAAGATDIFDFSVPE